MHNRKPIFKNLESVKSEFKFSICVINGAESALRGLSSGLIFKKASWYHVLAFANSDALHINSSSSLRGELRAGE